MTTKQSSTPNPDPVEPADELLEGETPVEEPGSFADEWNKLGGKPPDPVEEEETPAPVDEAADEPAEEPEATAQNLWAGLTDKQKEALGSLNQQLSEVTHRAQSDSSRVSALQRKIDGLARAAPAGGAPSAVEVTQALKTPEGWKQLTEDYPTIAGPIEEFLKAGLEGIKKQVEETVKQRVEPLLARADAEEEVKQANFVGEQVSALTKAHPEWRALKDTAEFKSWIAGQPPLIQGGIKSQHAADAIHVLDLYKGSLNGDTVADLTQRRNKRLQQAASVQGLSGRAATSRPSAIPDNFDAAWDALGRQSANQKK